MFERILPETITLEALFDRFSPEEGFAFLDSASGDPRLGRYSIMAFRPFMRLRAKGRRCELTTQGAVTRHETDPLAFLEELMGRWTARLPEGVPFAGGAIGYLAYDLGRLIETLPEKAEDDRDLPDLLMDFHHGAVLCDHREETLRYVDHDLDGLADQRAKALLAELEKPSPRSGEPFRLTGPLEKNMTEAAYLGKVRRIKDYIRTGDIYQANMTLRYSAPCTGEPRELYRRLRRRNPAPFAAYLECGDHQVLSSSPERFIEVRGRRIETRPIKGTVPRGRDEKEDARMRQMLEESEKDHAELLMIVDLERNDLGRVARIGSVRVPELFAIESYQTVHHLVATVAAELDDGVGLEALLRAVFPGGSITGAPKIRAMEIIDEVEPTRRNLYTGAIGYLDFSGDMDLNIIIRTLVVNDGRVDYQVGGGIVWDSDEVSEFQETGHKGRALREVLTDA